MAPEHQELVRLKSQIVVIGASAPRRGGSPIVQEQGDVMDKQASATHTHSPVLLRPWQPTVTGHKPFAMLDALRGKHILSQPRFHRRSQADGRTRCVESVYR
jgi:hypothetical protein